MSLSTHDLNINRRQFISGAAKLATGLLVSSPLTLWAAKIPPKRALSFYNTHTLEELDITYARDNRYNPEALQKVNRFLRDHRTGDIHPIDPGLLDILYSLQQHIGKKGVVEVISGYRSPKSNSLLRKNSNGVARRSLHLEGRAIDIRMTGIKTKKLRNVALKLKRGGVGYYAKSDFVHLDTGRFRTW